jgi:hypothetical protein
METGEQLPCRIVQDLWPGVGRGDHGLGEGSISGAASITGRSVGHWDILSGRSRVS